MTSVYNLVKYLFLANLVALLITYTITSNSNELTLIVKIFEVPILVQDIVFKNWIVNTNEN